MSEVHGICDGRFGALRGLLERNLASGADVGASVAVFIDGEPVVDIYGGTVAPESDQEWAADTITNVWSTTKTMTFLVALMLADRGELAFDAPVAKYWPEFAQAGKEHVEVRHLMSHSAGLAGWTEHLEPGDLADWELCTSRLAAQRPWWEPGTSSGYHAITQGYLIGEVVRRVTGTTIGRWFRSEVAEPLGADFWIGLPESEDHRVSPIIPPRTEALAEMLTDFADPESFATRAFTNPLLDPGAAAEPWWRRPEIPAANGHGNARSVALVQSAIACGGTVAGTRLLSEAGAKRAFDVQIEGMDLVLGFPFKFGMGYGLGNELVPLSPGSCFWGGMGGSIVVMDTDARMCVAYMMNKMATNVVGDLRGFEIVLAAAGAIA